MQNIFVARDAGRAVAAIAVKPFAWIAGGREFAAAMIGMVWTDPAWRGQGIATRLLQFVDDALRPVAEFAVLWTARPDFYARSGWLAGDCASFGEIAGTGSAQSRGSPADFALARPLWQSLAQRVARDPAWEPPLPLAALSLEMYAAQGAYALAGRQGDALYCYEILGEPARFDAIFRVMRAGCRTLYFNERTGSPAYQWLAREGVSWQDKPLAMWLPLRASFAPAATHDWYIPWLDRI